MTSATLPAPERVEEASRQTARTIAVAVLPLAGAIAVFGTIYGAAAEPTIGAALTIATSLLVFSGTLQFATLGLVALGAGPAAVLLTAAALNSRHLVLGALLRPRLDASAPVRAVLAWFLVDESFGLAYAARRRTAATLLIAGLFCYGAWQLGTGLGILGARIEALEDAAGAVFPVLFIGLAAVTSSRRSLAIRAAAAALLVAAISLTLPVLSTLAPVIGALVVALPGERAR